MCGICGSVSVAGRPVDPAPVRRMLRAMVHRGPDSEGLLEAPGLVAGIRRLRVIDLETGDQPIAGEDGRVRVVFNGEIYNHRELRRELEANGHRFRTSSDTEVLVHLWEDHGPAMLERLHGMFALCIRDDRGEGETFLARDRLGIKPLVWHRDGDVLAFASEPGVLLQHPAVSREVDFDGLLDRYVLQFVPGERTPYRDVRKLPPGHVVRIRGGEVEVRRWWSEPGPTEVSTSDEGAAAEELRTRLDDAVRERTVADVPLGMFLSGGVDSSAVLATLARHADGPVRTFTVGFEDAGALDERAHAREVAGRFGARHEESVVSAASIGAWLPRLIERTGEPVTDPALIPTWLLSEFARREVTVVLTGEGADELFAGYRRHVVQHRWGWLGRLPGIGTVGRTAAGALPGRAGQALQAIADDDPVSNHLRWSAVVGEDVVDGLFGSGTFGRVLGRTARVLRPAFEPTEGPAPSPLAARLRADRAGWLPHDLLDKVDRASMAHSLEARVPFLDHRMVAFAASLPDRFRIRDGHGKWILRRAFRGVLPDAILDRPKRGFDLPLDRWLREALRPLAVETFTASGIERWPGLDRDFVFRMFEDHVAGRRRLGLPLFNLLSILLFLRGVR